MNPTETDVGQERCIASMAFVDLLDVLYYLCIVPKYKKVNITACLWIMKQIRAWNGISECAWISTMITHINFVLFALFAHGHIFRAQVLVLNSCQNEKQPDILGSLSSYDGLDQRHHMIHTTCHVHHMTWDSHLQ